MPVSPHFSESVGQLAESGTPPIAAGTIYSSQGIKLIDKGARVDPRLYERLMQHQLSAPLEDSLQAEDSVTGKGLRAVAEDLIRRRPVLQHMLDKPGLQAMLLDALESLPLPAPIAFQLSVARDVHPELFQYSVCTALIAGWLASTQSTVRFDISMLTAGGLLHDLGMMHIDPVLLQAEGRLTREQRRQLSSHPLVSALLLERHHEYPRELIRAVREHHEMLDGSGYPAGLAGDKISPWGRMLSLVQVVSALLRPGRGVRTARLSMLLRTNRHHFDRALCDRVLAVLRRLLQEATPATMTEMASFEPVANPVERLNTIDRVLAAWPEAITKDANVPPARRAAMGTISEQCTQMRRILAETGATTEQLEQLGEDAHDEILLEELALITRELAWQLRMLARQTRRRWHAAPKEALPQALEDWLVLADTTSSELLEASAAAA